MVAPYVNYTRAMPLDDPTMTVVCRSRRAATAGGPVADANGEFVARGTTTCVISEMT